MFNLMQLAKDSETPASMLELNLYTVNVNLTDEPSTLKLCDYCAAL
jgi:hypothetical protein